jgi:transcriptional regulator GlxA family with amidase domain
MTKPIAGLPRRQFLGRAAALPLLPVLVNPMLGEDDAPRLTAPASGHIGVAFLVSDGATVIDFAGPWEVFQDTHVESRGSSHDDQMPFRLYTVADEARVVRATGGLQVKPDYTIDDAPAPRVVVVPAMRASARVVEWLQKTAPKADLVMSVCTGAFVLARAGLLSKRPATTHHDFLDRLAREYPDVKVQRGVRYVESGAVATAAGLTSGIDLALRVVERYFGRAVADQTARYMEHERAPLR